MKQHKITVRSRILLIISAVMMVIVLFVPMWKIDLVAPQYPEGLALIIHPNGLRGNVDIINGLNHYIGMKHLHTDDFVEFKVLPYIIIFFAALFLVVAFTRSKLLLNITTVLFICFGIIAMVDFWRWEYNYGHTLDPNAAIVVPGMAYQPPLIGFKQLLNFSAWAFPAAGGWLFAGTGVLLLFAVISERVQGKRLQRKIKNNIAAASVVFLFFAVSSCNTGPEPIQIGKDHCDYCKMTFSDARFGAEIVTAKGKVYKFDDAHCLLAFLKEGQEQRKEDEKIYFVSFSGNHVMIASGNAMLLKSDQLRSPMGGNIAAFENKDSLHKVQIAFPGEVVSWKDIAIQ